MATQSASFTESPAIPPSQEASSNQLLLDGYLRREELAQQLGVSPRTIDRWQTARCGPPRVAIGRTILYNLESVREWLRSNEGSACNSPKRARPPRPAPR